MQYGNNNIKRNTSLGLDPFYPFLLFQVILTPMMAIAQILSGTLPFNNKVCPGKELILNCTVNGPHLAWSSNEYIGSNDKRVEFGLFDNPGEEYHKNVEVELLSSSRSASKPMIVSQLKLHVLASHPYGTVVCHDVSAGTSENITFITIGEYFIMNQYT